VSSNFTLPELGENIDTGDVLRVLVKPGDELAKDQPVLELETDKATVEVPSSVAGRIREVRVKAGDKIKVGQVILSVDDEEGAAAGVDEKKGAVSVAAGDEPRTQDPPPTGSDPRERPDRDPSPPKAAPEPSAQTQREEPAGRDRKVVNIARSPRPPVEPATSQPAAPAAPSVRRMARELGVEISQVAGTGPNGRISIDDVKAHAKRIITGADAVRRGQVVAEPLPDFTRWGEIERQPMRAVRRKTAQHVTAAWTTIPHVTQHELADVTELEELRKRYGKKAEEEGGKLTVTAVAVKVVAAALRVFPQMNVSVDLTAEEIIVKKYVNIGIAVDTDRGLLVPVIRDADTKSIVQLSVEIAQLSEKARKGKIALDDLQGGCFSISNLGGIGGTFFTPIINAPEVGILGISRARMEPVYSKETEQFVPRLMLPLSLSYDHRAIDGADGIRFLRWVAEALEQPFLIVLQD
jgi:pyruvate dehydrogenase E2 component (dihydrolipoamide acetyltransferase)